MSGTIGSCEATLRPVIHLPLRQTDTVRDTEIADPHILHPRPPRCRQRASVCPPGRRKMKGKVMSGADETAESKASLVRALCVEWVAEGLLGV